MLVHERNQRSGITTSDTLPKTIDCGSEHARVNEDCELSGHIIVNPLHILACQHKLKVLPNIMSTMPRKQ